MTFGLTLRPESEQDIENAANWYQSQREGLGHRFLDEALETLRTIAERPESFPVVHRGVRRALIRRFPFGIFYRFESNAVVVLAVMHASRDPRGWKRRT